MPIKSKNNLVKIKPNIKSIFKIPLKKQNYLAIIKNIENFKNDNLYHIINVTNLRHYFHNHSKKRLILISYFIVNNDFDISYFDDLRLHSTNKYMINDITELKSNLKKLYNIEEQEVILNHDKNNNLTCKKCSYNNFTLDMLCNHLKECESFRYTLFGEPVPKELRKSKKTVTNNLIINNTYNYHTSFRKTGDYIRDNISTEQQLAILNSIDKISEMVKYHFMFPEIAENIRIKNTSPYSTCEIFDGKTFKNVNNFDTFRYYVLDHLDSLDYMAYYLKNDKITRALEKYDDNIRKNDQNMAKCIKKTIKDVKFLRKIIY